MTRKQFDVRTTPLALTHPRKVSALAVSLRRETQGFAL
jgi:hypothetical protein